MCVLTASTFPIENTILKHSVYTYTQLYCSLYWNQPFDNKKSQFMVQLDEVHLAPFENGILL